MVAIKSALLRNLGNLASLNMSVSPKTQHTRWAFNFAAWDPTTAEIELATSCIQAEEKERLAKFVYKNDFKSSLIGRLLLRKFAADSTSLPYNAIKFERDDKGKPLLANKTPGLRLNYNVSHQGSFTVLAGTATPDFDVKLGVDVMKCEFPRNKSLGEYFRVMARIFASSEWESIRAAGSEHEQLAMFARHWCLKESYLKAVGVGITVNLQDVCFKVKTPKLSTNRVCCDTEAFFNGVKLEWEFQETMLDGQHCVAVALSGRNNELVLFKFIDFGELMANSVPFLDRDADYCNNFFKKLEK